MRRSLALAIALAVSGCATNPVTGRQELVFMSPEREAAMGKQAAAQVEREMGIVRDPKLTAYVQQIGGRMAKLSPRQDVKYSFAIADMAEPNAFALPGGYVYVSRGLLALANDEDELAGVIGHEIGHVAARHSAQRETRQMGVGILSVLGTIAAGVVGGGQAAQAASQLGRVAGAGYVASYSRDQERQADDIGQKLAAAGGWDPEGLADFLLTLDREGKVRTGKSRQPTFLDTHPQPGERSVVARERAPTLARGDAAQIAKGRDAYLKRIDGLLVGPDPAEGVFVGQRFLHPPLGLAIEFPTKWQTQNTKQVVAAMAPERDAMLLLEMQGPRENPKVAAQRWAQKNRVRVVQSEATNVGGWPAFHALAEAEGQQGTVAADVTWIAHPAGTFRITGLVSPQRYRARQATFERVVGSFRPITTAERREARPMLLRIATARRGESLTALGSRTGNRWSDAETAVANGIQAGAPLREGQKIKIAVQS
jgi:predicted Zn-dependent protease